MAISKSPYETQQVAAKIAQKVKDGGVICLFGDLGSGKTTFTQAVAEALGINRFSIKSPTYTYIRHYPLKKDNLYHIDLYRLDAIDQLLLQELTELMENKNNILIIEWADKLLNYLPSPRIEVFLKYLGENEREIIIKNIDN